MAIKKQKRTDNNRCELFHCARRGGKYCCYYCLHEPECAHPCLNKPDKCGKYFVFTGVRRTRGKGIANR